MTEPTPGHVVGVVLAAGMSRRLGRPKQLLDLHGEPLIVHVVRRALQSKLDRVIVVTGHESGSVREALTGLAVELVTNDRYAEGQSTSLIAGIDAVGESTDAIVVLLSDQPEIDPMVIDRLIEVRRTGRAPLAMATYGKDRGHPVLFGSELFPELRSITGDQGGRDVVQRHRSDLVLVPAGEGPVPMDVDTEADYGTLLHRFDAR